MGSPIAAGDLVMLDITDPRLDPNGPEVRAARAAHWCARTPLGLAVLRHDKLTLLLGDRRLAQGSRRILASQGLTTGPLVEWMNSMILYGGCRPPAGAAAGEPGLHPTRRDGAAAAHA